MKNASNDTKQKDEKNKKKRFDRKEQMSLNKSNKAEIPCKIKGNRLFLFANGTNLVLKTFL